MADQIYADVSEFQAGVNDTYPYRMIAIRSDDGTYRDAKFAANYAWCCSNADAGKLDCFIVYAYWRSNWDTTLATMKAMVGTPHPKMIVMIDLESGGNPSGDQSDGVNRFYWGAADWLGDPKRVIGYGNVSDLNSMWVTKPPGVRLVVAGYGTNPSYPGKIAHQYTDGVYSRPLKAQANGHTDEKLRAALGSNYGSDAKGAPLGASLPLGAPPFGNCDMNSADGLSAADFAAACGITSGGFMADLTVSEQQEVLTGARQLSRAWSITDVGPYVAGGENWAAGTVVNVAEELFKPRTSLVEGSTYSANLGQYILNTDASAYRTEQTVNQILAAVSPKKTARLSLPAFTPQLRNALLIAAGAVLSILVVYGFLDSSQVDWITALLTAVLGAGVGGGTVAASKAVAARKAARKETS